MIRNIFLNYFQRLWYEVHWFLILVGFRFYFRRWQVHNYPKMKRKDPVIYVANHQNAFMDAIAIVLSQKRHPIFLARASVFANPIAKILLRSINMLPIYRQRDGVDTIKMNESIIQSCVDILIEGRQPLGIHAEGNHGMKRSLRPLKKGLGRIAFQAMEQTNNNLNLKVVPVGIGYSKHTRFRGDLLINFGEPIKVKDYVDVYRENPNKALVDLNIEIEKRIKGLIVNIDDIENYEEIEKAWIRERKLFPDMLEELASDKEIIARLTEEKQQGKTLNTEPVEKNKPSVISMIIGFPAYVYGTLNHLPAKFLISRVIKNIVSDLHFYSSIKLVSGMYIGMIMYFLQALAVYALTGGNMWIASLYFFSLPFFGIYAYDHHLKYYSDEPYTTSSAELLKKMNK
ncbi:MAG: 1-acyl-sn-glycerol-3-phosphate acyltransferase [Bacteroidota bacterium]